MGSVALVDAHHHLWNPVSSDPDVGYVWLRDIGAPKPFGDPTPIQRDYLLEEFLEEPRPIPLEASVHVQADGAIDDPIAETAFIQEVADRQGFAIAIVGFVDLAGDSAGRVLERHGRHNRFRGVRQILSRLADRPDLSFAKVEYLSDPRWRDQYALLSDAGLSFDLQCYPEQMAAAAEFLSAHPDVPVILNHAGSPWDQSGPGMRRWREGVALLSGLAHVSVKVCGLGMFDRGWTATSVRPLFEHLTEMFGPKRMMFGSNFPVESLMRSYDAITRDMLSLVSDWPLADQACFFSENARRIYRP